LTVPGDPPLIVGGGWQAFTWTAGPGSFNDEGAFTFVNSSPVRLTVTDACYDGDQFRIYDHGSPIGLTSTPVADGSFIGPFPDLAVADPRWSSGTFLIGAGSHEIDLQIQEVASPYDSGGGFLRADLAVPAPATLALLGSGAASLIGFTWRRRKMVNVETSG
jgi:hypothetical protein